jgi:hypothetical protein
MLKAAALAAFALSVPLLMLPGAKPELLVGAPTGSAAKSASLSSVCAPGTLPDGNQCVPVPIAAGSEDRPAAGERVRALDHIPRRPDRPADFKRYRYPLTPRLVEPETAGTDETAVTSIALHAQPGSDVRAIALTGQEGDATVLFTGALQGTSVVTHHRVREAGTLRDYFVIIGALESVAPGVKKGAPLPVNQPLGALPARGENGEPSLFLAVRRLRSGYDLASLESENLLTSQRAISCDPRNVLALASP